MSETHNHNHQYTVNQGEQPMFVLPQVQSARSGPSILDLYGLLFVALRLVGVIHWSWFFVLAPIWLPALWAFGSFFFGRVVARKIAKRKAVRW